MKKHSFLFVLTLFLGSLFAQNDQMVSPTQFVEMPALTSNTPAWAVYLYTDPVNWDELEEAYNEFYGEESDSEGEEEDSENAWKRAYKNLRNIAPQYRQADGTLRKVSHSEIRARAEADMAASQLAATSVDDRAAGWSALGPKETFFPTQAFRNETEQVSKPWQANVYCIDVAPSNANILYCGTETGFVYKTIDKGLNWTCVSEQYKFGIGSPIHSIEIHPTNPNIVYLMNNNSDVYKTIDGGLTWTLLPSIGIISTAYDIAISPGSPETVFIATGSGLYRSSNGGLNWNLAIFNICTSIDFKPNAPLTVYAMALDPNDSGKMSFFKSTDGGSVFSQQTIGWPTNLLNESYALIATTPANVNYVYVVYLTQTGPVLLKSTNSGTSWTVTATGNIVSFSGASGVPLGMSNGQGFYDLGLVVSSTNAEQVIVGTTSTYKSVDGGLNFFPIGGYFDLFDIHADIQQVITQGNDTWIATDGGISYSTDFFSSKPQTRMNGVDASDYWGFGQGWQEDVAVGGRYHNGNGLIYDQYANGKSLYIGGAENQTGYGLTGPGARVVTSDGYSRGFVAPKTLPELPKTFDFSFTPVESAGWINNSTICIHPNYYKTHILPPTVDGTLFKSEDDGKNFNSIGTSTGFGYMIQSRINPNLFYGINGQQLLKTTNSWSTSMSLTLPNNGNLINYKFTINPLNDNEIYSMNTDNFTTSIWRSTNGGTTWTDWTGPSLTIANIGITDVEFAPGTNGGGVYIFSGPSGRYSTGKIFYRNVNATDWQDISENIPANFGTINGTPFYKKGKIRIAGNKGIYERDLVETPPIQAMPAVDKKNGTCLRDTFYFADNSIYSGNATFSWSFSPTPSYISSATAQNPKVVFGTAGNYSATLTVAVAGQTSNTRTISNMVTVPANACVETRPDFYVGLLTASSGITGRISFHINIGNLTAVSLTGLVNYALYLSADQILDSNDKLIDTPRFFPPSLDITDNVAIPDGVLAGNYFLIAKVDANNNYLESNENNNVLASTTTYTVNRGSGCTPDITPPTYDACPQNINIITPVGTPATASWLTPNFTDNCAYLIGVTATNNQNETFPIGVTTVKYIGYDQANNATTCSFTISVTQQTGGGSCTGNLLDNGGFESSNFNTDYWLNQNGATVVNDPLVGARALSMCTVGSVLQTKVATTGTNYTFQAACKKTGIVIANIYIKFIDANFNPLQTDFQSITSPTYLNIALTKTAPVGAAYIEVGFIKFEGSGCIFADEACLTTGGGPNPCSPDVTPPVVSGCPANINLTTAGTSAIATWTNPTATDACGTATFTSNFNSGASFPIGATPVNYAARDAANNVAICSFTVTVTQNGGGGCTGNLLTNNGFESDFASWNNPDGATIVTDAQSGTKAMSLCTATSSRVYQFKTAIAGTTYTFKAFCKKTGTAPTNIFIKYMNASFTPIQTDFQQVTSATYAEVTLSKLAPTGAAYMEIGFLKDNGTGCLLADEACLTTGGGGNPCVPDVTAPSITGCPANLNLTTAGTTSIATWTAPTTSDACGAATLTSNFNSGASFPIGSTTVTYTARDVANNSAVCSFIVTVTLSGGGGCTSNLLTNNGFESSFTGWENPNGATIVTDAQAGTKAASICTATPSRVYQFKTATAGTTYTFKAFAKKTGTAPTNIFIKFMNSGFSPIQTDFQQITSTTYTEVTISKLAPTGAAYMEVGFIKDNGTGCLLADEACLTTGGGGNPCVPDVIAPTISGCPSNLSLTTTAASTTASWTAPTATDACGAATLTSNFNSGASFPIGSTTVTYTARDAANNSAVCSFTVTVTQNGGGPLPDLNVINLTVPTTTIAAGAVLNYSFTARNTGTATTGNFSIKAYFSTDNVLSANDIQDGTINTGNFTAGTANLVNGASTVPASLAAGNYFLIIKMDADNQVVESNEANNEMASATAFAVTNGGGGSGADLQITMTADKTQVAQWTNVVYTIVAKNNGTSPITAATIRIGGCSTGFEGFVNTFGLVYSGVPGQPTLGSYNYIGQEWTLSNLAAGQSGTLVLTLFSTTTNQRKVAAYSIIQSPTDPDSQPSSTLPNCVAVQDDEAVWTINAGQAVLVSGGRLDQTGSENLSGQEQVADFQLFPNPAGDMVLVKLSIPKSDGVTQSNPVNTLTTKITLFNQLGVKIMDKTFDLDENLIKTIDLSGVSNGQYFVRMEMPGQRTIVKRLLVARMY
jgi:hypothetical protein